MADKGTEQATPQRKKKAREDGDFVRSRELLAAVSMLAGVLVLGAMSSRFVSGWMRVYIDSLSGLRDADLSSERGVELVRRTMLPGMAPIAMVMVAAFAGSLLMGLLQGGGLGIHTKSLAFNFDRINPVTNMGHLFSLRSTTRVLKSLVPAGIMAIFGWYGLHSLMAQSPVMSMVRLPQTFSTAYVLALDAAWVALAWSGLDYAIERRAWNQRLMMTKQQIREEMRDATGNPQIKARVRQIQRAMRRRRVKADMSRASVLITNPTHYAVALEFSFETMQAPTVLAKGRDLHALEMREEARWAGVPIIENPPLARSLYQAVEPGSAIPFALYQAVAGILAFLYRQRVEEKLRSERAAKAAQAAKTAESEMGHRVYEAQRGAAVIERMVPEDSQSEATEGPAVDTDGAAEASNEGDL